MDYNKEADEFLSIMCQIKKPVHNPNLEKIAKGGYFMLGVLEKNGGNMKPSDLAKEAHISSARVAALLNLQEEKGNIIREPIPGDRRQTNIVLTSKGYELTRKIHEETKAEMVEYLSFLGEEKTKHMLEILQETKEYYNKKAMMSLGKEN